MTAAAMDKLRLDVMQRAHVAPGERLKRALDALCGREGVVCGTYSVSVAAKRMGVSRQTMTTWLKEGRFGLKRIGDAALVSRALVESIVDTDGR